MSENLITFSVKNYFRFIRRANLKLFVYIIFFGAVIFVSEIKFLPEVAARQVNETDRKKVDDEQEILAEIRIAKNFIENEEWEKARVKLTGIINDFPQNRYLDIAYYWLAYTLFQQKNFSEAEQTIADLQRKFPDSAWIDESKSLLVEINSKNGWQINLTSEEFSKSDDETKAFAVQNLLETDRSKAMIMIDEILGSASKAADNLKESVLILLFDDKSDWATEKFIQVIKTGTNENLVRQALIGLGKRDEKKVLPVLRDFLQQNTNENLTDAALYSVSKLQSEASVANLIYFAQNGSSQELKQKSIIWIGNGKSKRAIEELKKLYSFYTDVGLKEQVQISLSEINTPESLQVLIGLIEGETNKDLVEHGLELLKEKTEPSVLRYLEKKLQVKN